MSVQEKAAPLCRCGHSREEHAVFIDNGLASTNAKEERRSCMHQVDVGAGCEVGCECYYYRPGPVLVSEEVHQKPANVVPLKARSSDPGPVQENMAEDTSDEPKIDEEIGLDPFRRGLICDTCVGLRYPGILLPMNGDEIQKCDDCDLFVDDKAAAVFLSAVTGIPIRGDGDRWFAVLGEQVVFDSIAAALRLRPI